MSFSDSAVASATLELSGVWLHDPLDPEGTAINYPYGGARGRLNSDTLQEATYYAGREFPVLDIGQHRSVSVQATVHVENGPEWLTRINRLREVPSLRRALVYRDGRSRNLTGALSGLTEQDQAWGSEVSFTFTQMDA